ncbi:MAG: tetratricopeptide repeat protein, partial [Bacteroidia bacterium]|nr:tetratricopeptide repeat protein [Bacteroidia bacterium]
IILWLSLSPFLSNDGNCNAFPFNKADSIIALIKSAKNDTTRIQLYLKAAKIYGYNQSDSALLYYNNGLQLAQKNIDNKQQPEDVYLRLKGILLSEQGILYFIIGNYPTALQNYLDALRIYEKITDSLNIAYTYINIGRVKRFSGPEFFSEAIEYLNKGLKIFENKNFQTGQLNTFYELGVLYSDPINQQFLNPDLALDYFKKALDIAKQQKNEKEIATLTCAVGWIYSLKEDYRAALEMQVNAMKIFEKNNDEENKNSCYTNIAYYYAKLKNYSKAEEYFSKALEIAQKWQYLDGINNIYESLSNINFEQGNYQKALEYYRRSVEIKFKIYTNEKINAMAEMQTKYETEKKQQKIELLNKEKQLKEVELKRRD